MTLRARGVGGAEEEKHPRRRSRDSGDVGARPPANSASTAIDSPQPPGSCEGACSVGSNATSSSAHRSEQAAGRRLPHGRPTARARMGPSAALGGHESRNGGARRFISDSVKPPNQQAKAVASGVLVGRNPPFEARAPTSAPTCPCSIRPATVDDPHHSCRRPNTCARSH